MLVNFDYECPNGHKREVFFSTALYPQRDFPKYLVCGINNCNQSTEMQLNTTGMQPDSYWAGKEIKSLGISVSSKSYLKRYCKTEGITQLTDEELKTTKCKTKSEIINQYMNKPEVTRERKRIISESLDGYGVIDSVNMEN